MTGLAIPAVDAYSKACQAGPLLTRDSQARRSVELHGWNTGPTKEVHIAETHELIMSVHLGGARRVRVFTENGLSRSFSKPGDITLIPRGKPVSYRTDGAVQFATVHFPVTAPSRGYQDLWKELSSLEVCLFALHDDYVLSSVKALMQVEDCITPKGARYVATLLEALTCHIAHIIERRDAEQVHLIGQPPPPRSAGPDFEAVLREIDRRLADKLSLQVLADHAGVCRSVFAEHFMLRFGCSAHRYITERRIEKAKRLLIEGRLSVTDIAYEVGFSGQSHFSTTFKALTGVVPKAFSQQSQGMTTADID